jgi:teichuronic acid biosynthesis glycosyltransferase TuaC
MVTSEWPTAERPYHAPYLKRQVDFLRRAGVDVDVFAFRGARKPMNYLRARRRLHAQLSANRYDLVHAQFGQSALLVWPRRIPLVVTFHGCDLQGVKRPDGRMSASGLILQRLCRAIGRRAEAVIVVSDRMRQFLPPSIQAPVIPTGIDFDTVPRITTAEARRQLGLPLDERLVLFVGNPNEPVKRHHLAAEAVALLEHTLKSRLIVGWGMQPSEILLLMTACDVLVVSSIQEGSPGVVKEALACNLPVVSVDVGDVPLRLAGVEGCEVCADDSPATIAAALERVLRRGTRIDGRDRVRDLDERVLASRVIAIYQSIVPGRRRVASDADAVVVARENGSV